jgi:RNA ligase (TIGR02306 family)
MERKLASIQKVVDLQPIENADAIEVATILGWHCVVKKGEVEIGQPVVYFEVDSILPTDKPEFAFLEKSHGRIKTIKLRGQISQGLALPLSTITYQDLSVFNEDDDVTELLGVTKYEPPEPGCGGGANLGGRSRGNFPHFLHKTDEIRIQSVPGVLERHRGKKFYISEKIDGSSFTSYLNEDIFGICSRNLDLMRDEDADGNIKNVFWKTAVKIGLEDRVRSLGNLNLGFQGELAGPGIQKNKYGLTDYEIFFFNVYDIDEHKYLDLHDFQCVIEGIGLRTVPILDVIELNHTVDQLVEMSKGSSILKPVKREGIIFRPIIEDFDPKLGRLSFKVINPEFLLQHKE